MHETYDAEILRKLPQSAAPPVIGPRLGIVGGGQLARMTAMAALQLGCDVVVLERNRFSPAATLATHSLVGDWNAVECAAAARGAGGCHFFGKRIRGRRPSSGTGGSWSPRLAYGAHDRPGAG